jgi:hypothetical protein
MATYGFRIDVEGNAVKQIQAIEGAIDGLNRKQKKQDREKAFGGMGAGLGKLAVVFAGLSVGKFFYDTATGLEQTAMSLEVMLGSAEKAKKMMGELKQFADLSPLDDKTVYDGAKLLMNYGIEAEKVKETIGMLGDIAGADAVKFDRLALAFGQVKSNGMLMGDDLRQMTEAGFNPLLTMSGGDVEKYRQLRKEMSKGNISFDMMEEAFRKETSEGGKFFKMTETQAASVGGKVSTMIGGIQNEIFNLFNELKPTILKVVEGLTVAIKPLFEIISYVFTSIGDIFTIITGSDDATDRLAKMKAAFDGIAVAVRFIVASLKQVVELVAYILELVWSLLSFDWGKIPERTAKFTERMTRFGNEAYGIDTKGKSTANANPWFMSGLPGQLQPNYVMANGGASPLAGVPPKNQRFEDELKKNVKTTAALTSSGGLGSQKQINIKIENVMQVNAEAMDAGTWQSSATSAAEEILRIINNAAYGQGVM